MIELQPRLHRLLDPATCTSQAAGQFHAAQAPACSLLYGNAMSAWMGTKPEANFVMDAPACWGRPHLRESDMHVLLHKDTRL